MYLLTWLFFLFCGFVHQAQCPTLNLPKNFTIRETVGSGLTPFVYDFEVLDENELVLGTIASRIFRLHSTMELFNSNQKLVALAKAKYVSWGTQVEIEDCNGNLLGRIREESVVKKRLLSLGSLQSYLLESSDGQSIGSLQKFDTSALTHLPFGGIVHKAGLGRNTLFKLRNQDGKVVVKMTRSFLQPIRDTWVIEEVMPHQIHESILLYFPAYRTRVDSVLKPQNSHLKKRTNLFQELYPESSR
jgi:hypothetical protein